MSNQIPPDWHKYFHQSSDSSDASLSSDGNPFQRLSQDLQCVNFRSTRNDPVARLPTQEIHVDHVSASGYEADDGDSLSEDSHREFEVLPDALNDSVEVKGDILNLVVGKVISDRDSDHTVAPSILVGRRVRLRFWPSPTIL